MSSSDREESIASEVLAASLGGALSAAILYPLEVLKTKMQASQNNNDDSSTSENNESNMTMYEFARHLIATQGIQVFWTGFETSALQSATEKALYFFAYTGLKNIYSKTMLNSNTSSTTTNTTGQAGSIPTLANLILGCMAEWAHLPITLPLDCWTTRIQTQTNSSMNTDDDGNDQGAMTLLCNMLSEKGVKGMYKGIQAYVVLCLKPAIQYTVFEQVKRLLLQRKNRQRALHGTATASTHLTALESFVLGMVARMVATILVFPYIRAKVVLQTSAAAASTSSSPTDNGDNNNNNEQRSSTNSTTAPPTSIAALLTDMYKQQGIGACFQGLGPELTRGIFSAALMLMIKEQLTSLVHKALYGGDSQRASSSSLVSSTPRPPSAAAAAGQSVLPTGS